MGIDRIYSERIEGVISRSTIEDGLLVREGADFADLLPPGYLSELSLVEDIDRAFGKATELRPALAAKSSFLLGVVLQTIDRNEHDDRFAAPVEPAGILEQGGMM